MYQEVGSSLKLIRRPRPRRHHLHPEHVHGHRRRLHAVDGERAAYVRTETLAAYDARVPVAAGTTCVPRPTHRAGHGPGEGRRAVRATSSASA